MLWPKRVATELRLDGSKPKYTLTFAAGQFPPVNAFWILTIYDGKTRLLIPNPINRYLVNSSMLPSMKKDKDGSLTLYIQRTPRRPTKSLTGCPRRTGQ